MQSRFVELLSLYVTAALMCGPALGADQRSPPAPAASVSAQAGAIAVSGPSGAERLLTPQEIETLSTVQVTVAVEPGHGSPQRTFEGPLLWAVLNHAGAVDAAKFREHVRQAVVVTGSDGPGAGPGGRPVRDIYIQDFRLGSGIKVPTRDFR